MPGAIRIVAQVSHPRDVALGPVRFFVNDAPAGDDAEGPPYAVEWTDANPFEPTRIRVEASDAAGNTATDAIELEPFEILETTGVSRVLPIADEDPGTPHRIARTVETAGAQGVLTTNSLGGLAAAKGLAGTGVKIGTFDLGPDVLKAILAGEIGFAVDQPAYLQGDLPIEKLALRALYGVLPAQHDVVATGPNFVTPDDAAQALELAERSIR